MNLKWLKSKKLAMVALASALIMFLNIPEETKADIIKWMTMVGVGSQGVADGLSKGSTATKR